MDAVKFIEERNRMCNTQDGCRGCPAFQEAADVNTCRFSIRNGTGAEVLVRIVEEWTAAHPRKTRQDVFLEQWPDTQLDKEGSIIICPKQLCKGEEFLKLIAECRGTNCNTCRREFWMKEVE